MLKLIIFIQLIVCSYSFSQTVTVLDKTTNEPLEYVLISSESPKRFTTTNGYGKANLKLFNGTKLIRFQLLGYKPVELSYKEIERSKFLIHLLRESITLDQVLISANKWSQNSSEVPSRYAIITPKDIELGNPQTSADLLNISGEVFIQKSQQGGGSPMIRGFATNRVLISVDGIRMNNAIFRSGNIQNVISIDPFSVENTEVIFGPGSIIYGSDAIGGSMNFFTYEPIFSLSDNFELDGNVQYRFSSANKENTSHFDINFGWEKFASYTSFTYNSFDDLVMGLHGPDEYLRNEYVKKINGVDSIIINNDKNTQIPTGYNQLNLLQKFRYAPNTDWDIEYGFYYSKTSDYDRYDRLIRYSNGLPKSSEWYYGPQIWIMNNFTINNFKKQKLFDNLTVKFAHQFFEESRNDRDFKGLELTKRTENVNAFSLNIDLNKQINSISNLSYGLEYVFNEVSSKGLIQNIIDKKEVPTSSRYPNSTWYSIAAYFVYQRHLSSKFNLQTGLRYNYLISSSSFDTTFFPLPFTKANLKNGAFTGSVGLIFNQSKSLTTSINLSTGFRAPNIDDIGKIFDSEPGSVVVPNKNLKPEYAYNIDFNITKLFNKVFKTNISIYYTYLDNALVRRDYNFNGLDSIYYDGELSKVQAIQNAANAYIYGLQFGFDLSIKQNLLLKGNINLQSGKEELDDGSLSPLRHSSPPFGSLSLTYSKQDFKGQIIINYNGEISYSNLASSERAKDYLYAKDTNGNPYSPSWYTINFRASHSFFDKLKISFGVENITNQRYRPYSSGIAAAGRNFIISTKYSF